MRLIQSLASKELVRNLPKLKFDQHFCDACKIGKQAHVSHKAKNIVSTTRCLELLHIDLFGPSAVQSYGGNHYTLVIVDDYSREFDNEVQFGEFCNANGITHNFSAPRTPQSNGVVERKNRTLQEMKPKNVNEALMDDSWIVAMQEELNQFIANDVWELVPQPRNMTIIGTKWVFRNKLDENGIVSQNKARLVVQSYNQQEGINYDETYAPIARLKSIRILLAYACALDFKLFQIDVMAAPVISISSDTSEESVGSHAPRVILFGAIPAIIPVIPEVPVVTVDHIDTPEVGQFSFSQDSLPPAPDLPLVLPFLCSDDSEADGESEPAEQRPVSSSHDTLAPLSEFPLAPVVAPPRIRRRSTTLIRPGEAIPFGRPYRTHLNGPRKLLTARKRVRPLPARRLAWRRISHHSSDHHSSSDSSSSSAPSDHSLSGHTPPDTTDVDSSTPQRMEMAVIEMVRMEMVEMEMVEMRIQMGMVEAIGLLLENAPTRISGKCQLLTLREWKGVVVVKDFDDIAIGQVVTMVVSEHFLHTKPSIADLDSSKGVVFMLGRRLEKVLNEWVLDSFDIEADYARTRDDPYSRRFDEYKKVFNNEIKQLANKYDLRIGKKGYVLDDVWEKCEQIHEGTVYSWHDDGFKDEEQ
ncbi:retrovirus-related pol polyprotein from transposon TNT 1-94 [Tanacetum coccineum]|uniref:Retrovirus-related pol polyprotein from transposon TNT 1-94 n=1 Tax=Tanacetum coccineum TaxID=301880 RepID=A0ABQ4ZCT4_9ASTR